MNVTFVISSLAAGGAQKVLSVLANHWACKSGGVTLVTLNSPEEAPFFPLDARVHKVPLALAMPSSHVIQGGWNNIKRVLRLRRAIRASAPNVIVSFMDTPNVLTLIATRGLKLPVVISERVDPVVSPTNAIWALLRNVTYRLADRIVVQTERMGASFPKKIRKKIAVIPNPVLPPPTSGPSALPNKTPSIIAIGRLSRQKGFDLLLQAFVRLRERHPSWRLTILGEGPLRKELEGVRHELGLQDCVNFQGEIANPYRFLETADLFVLPSRYEGFPNALCEAMACGLACVAADCRTGPREIIDHEVNGLLFPPDDVDSLVERMDFLMSNPGERTRLGVNASRIASRFELGKIITMWDSLLNEVMISSGRRVTS